MIVSVVDGGNCSRVWRQDAFLELTPNHKGAEKVPHFSCRVLPESNWILDESTAEKKIYISGMEDGGCLKKETKIERWQHLSDVLLLNGWSAMGCLTRYAVVVRFKRAYLVSVPFFKGDILLVFFCFIVLQIISVTDSGSVFTQFPLVNNYVPRMKSIVTMRQRHPL